MRIVRDAAGSGLIEALIAVTVVVTALGTLAGLTSWSGRTVLASRDRTMAVVLAHGKLDTLSASPTPPPASHAGALEHDVAGFSERLDTDGRVAGADEGYRGAVFVRRWRVQPYGGAPQPLVITVLVSRCSVTAHPGGGCVPRADAVRVSAVRSGLAW